VGAPFRSDMVGHANWSNIGHQWVGFRHFERECYTSKSSIRSFVFTLKNKFGLTLPRV
jgi:hypothetical protein